MSKVLPRIFTGVKFRAFETYALLHAKRSLDTYKCGAKIEACEMSISLHFGRSLDTSRKWRDLQMQY